MHIFFSPPVTLCSVFLLFLVVYFAQSYNSTGVATHCVSAPYCMVHYEYYIVFLLGLFLGSFWELELSSMMISTVVMN